MRDILPADQLNPDEILRINAILRLLNKYKAGTKMLDVGCGDGRISIEKALDNCTVIGIDNNKGQLAEAEKYIPGWATENPPRYLYMDASEMEFPDNHFDIVMASEMLEHINKSDMIKVTREIKRVCKPDGTIMITVPWKNSITGSKEFPHLQSLDYEDLGIYFNIESTFEIPNEDGPGHWIGILARNVPKISIIIPSYNNSKYLNEAIDSIHNQINFQDYEIIVVEDGSTDNSLEIILEYDDVRVIMHTENKGVAQAWSTGFEAATGDYLMILSSDDAFTEYCFLFMYNRIKSDPNIVLVHGQVYNVAPDGKRDLQPWTPPLHDYDVLMRENYIGHAVLFDAKLKNELTVLGEKIICGEIEEWGCCDYGMWLKIADYAERNNKTFSRVEEPLYLYRNHPGATRNSEGRNEKMAEAEKIVLDKARKRRAKKCQ